ncbi:MAG: penicillin-binding transpeptidase domain-containing protein [Armatimonadota bacterium]|nr:penicillin-binding transpeptidase domain-containing protein [Armatimonadota bacterium]MDR7451746.1 penicillin-binding transpeptidase domain-containing protein [Armatimonadota bacterium]MDR7467371.1 penicillin-binding transpeptidase domain-containing protein [Armatimonadota bacterium]MDR7494141.1 penicillin-binding transpeptidase domain-containing protein [Armatimonadota bacterium]MDR7498893.1 penicillin-binding transpeptidase domain-containing protein [Armatimonadota bacterium]
MRLVHLQVVRGAYLAGIAQRQQLATIALEPHRGRLLDRRGRPLAINVEATSIYAVPAAISDPGAFAARVGPVLGLSTEELVRRLARGRYFVWLARKVRPEVVARMKALDLDEQIGYRVEDLRAYPNGALAAHVLGFVGIDNQGLAGVELRYDGLLRGRPGEAVAAHDGMGRILVETQRIVEAPVDGSDLLLTIDQVVQHIAERALEGAMSRTHARAGLVAAMDVRSGEILALALRPTFVPAAAGTAAPERWVNRAISEVYEPGSTFKVILAAAAVDSGAVRPTETFACPGFLRVGDRIIRDAGGRRHGAQTLGDVIKNSCNVGSAQVATRLGRVVFSRYVRAFGFGTPTRVDLPGEVGGLVPPLQGWAPPTLQTISFGQGISVTPVQLLAAVAALGNGGWLPRPHVVRAVRDPAGRLTAAADGRPARRVVRAETAAAVLAMMVKVVEEGSGRLARIDGYQVAGKTGTAQKAAPRGGYDPDRYVASFVGIVPADAPRLAILAILDEPHGAYYGSEVAAPVFREVASQTLWYLRIPPRTGVGRPFPP